MALDDDIRILAGVRLFKSFTPDQLRLLAFGAETTRLQPGKRLYRADDEADSAYVVKKGTIELFREDGDQRATIGKAGPGALLGELALISDTRRLTSAAAASEAEVLRLNRQMFRRILEEYPAAAAALREHIAEDLQAMIRRIEALAPKFAP